MTTWGWIELIAGAVVLLAGLYVMRGALWARIVSTPEAPARFEDTRSGVR
jgi:hypothetical protein